MADVVENVFYYLVSLYIIAHFSFWNKLKKSLLCAIVFLDPLETTKIFDKRWYWKMIVPRSSTRNKKQQQKLKYLKKVKSSYAFCSKIISPHPRVCVCARWTPRKDLGSGTKVILNFPRVDDIPLWSPLRSSEREKLFSRGDKGGGGGGGWSQVLAVTTASRFCDARGLQSAKGVKYVLVTLVGSRSCTLSQERRKTPSSRKRKEQHERSEGSEWERERGHKIEMAKADLEIGSLKGTFRGTSHWRGSGARCQGLILLFTFAASMNLLKNWFSPHFYPLSRAYIPFGFASLRLHAPM